MKKVLFIIAFLAIGMIANAQTQTIYSQLKLKTVNDGTASDSLVLVQGTDQIIRKIPLSSISPEVSVPSLQQVTNNGNVTTNKIYASEFRDESSPDSLFVANNRFLSLGDVGVNGNWSKYITFFEPNNSSDLIDIFNQDAINYLNNYNFQMSFDYSRITWAKGLSPSDWSTASMYFDDAGIKTNATRNFGEGSVYYETQLNGEYYQINSSTPAGVKSARFVFSDSQANGSLNLIELPNNTGTLATQEWVSANAGAASLQAVLGTGNTSTTKAIFNTTSDSNRLIDIVNTSNNNQTWFMPTGWYIRNSTKTLINANIVGGESGIQVTHPSNSSQVIMDGYRGYLKVHDGGFSTSENSTRVTNNSVIFKNSGFEATLTKPASLTATGSWTLPNKYGTVGVVNTTAPSSSTDTGVVGEIRVTSTYIYVCTAPNTWVRAALATW